MIVKSDVNALCCFLAEDLVKMPLCFFCCTIVLVSGYGLAAPLFPTIENKKTFCADFTG